MEIIKEKWHKLYLFHWFNLLRGLHFEAIILNVVLIWRQMVVRNIRQMVVRNIRHIFKPYIMETIKEELHWLYLFHWFNLLGGLHFETIHLNVILIWWGQMATRNSIHLPLQIRRKINSCQLRRDESRYVCVGMRLAFNKPLQLMWYYRTWRHNLCDIFIHI